MSNFWHSLRYIKLYKNDKNKGKFQSFVNFTKKINDNDFPSFSFYKMPYTFLLTSIMLKHVEVGKYIEYMRQKLRKNMLTLKFHPGMKCLHVFFSFFIPGWNFIPAFLGMSSSQDEISSRQKRVNSKRLFTIDIDEFRPRIKFHVQTPPKFQILTYDGKKIPILNITVFRTRLNNIKI